MAVNYGCSGYQSPRRRRMSPGDNDQEGNVPPRSRAASPAGSQTSPAIFNPYYTGRPRTPINGSKSNVLDRQEIIRRIKSGESRPTSPDLSQASLEELVKERKSPCSEALSPSGQPKSPGVLQDKYSIGMQIERPRSALHRGDFREEDDDESTATVFDKRSIATGEKAAPPFLTSTVAPWKSGFPTALSSRYWTPSVTDNGIPTVRSHRDRAASNASLTAGFVYKPPTSPLVQSSRPDTPEYSERLASQSPDKSRRHTFSPQSFQRIQASFDDPTSNCNLGERPLPRSGRSEPYQAHQPRRSLNTNSFSSLPQTPILKSNRHSIPESPLHHAPMVGSYEESILRGRMSTTPSKPLNFVAQIGVLGKGNCKSSLRCPPHASIPFPAVFYSYRNGGRTSPVNDQPSPYVGLIDLENGLPSAAVSPEKRRCRMHSAAQEDDVSRATSRSREDGTTSERRRKQKQKRRSGSPKAPPGGSYRIPQQGQLQIVIKNPNKTAVKLFLVPYDVSDMEAGQKTFIRQRSYSAGPIIDMPLASRKNLGTDRPEAAIITSDDPNERPTLRYLIHLHICCPSKGRYYLYKSVRVVFANRVPDGKEKLRNEIQLPDPRYSTYKPNRDPNIAWKDSHRSSETREPVTPTLDRSWPQSSRYMAHSLPATDFGMDFESPVQTLPRHFDALPMIESRPSSRHMNDNMDIDSQRSPDTQSWRSPLSSPTGDRQPLRIVTQLDEPFNFERDRTRGNPSNGRSESLLSKSLMDLAFQRSSSNADET